MPLPRLGNTPRLDDLLKDGKIYLSLSDAITLALENNFDIAIARINLDIADTDILRAKAGSTLRGVSTGLVTDTLGGSTTTITGGGGPGGDLERRGRRRHRRGWTGAEHKWRRPDAGEPGSQSLTGALQYRGAEAASSRTRCSAAVCQYLYTDTVDLQLRLQPGISDGHAA